MAFSVQSKKSGKTYFLHERRQELKGGQKVTLFFFGGEAKDGAEVLDLIKEIKPDLLFLDLQMPVLSGLEVFKLLPENSAFFVVFVTADEAKAAQIFEAGSVEYLLKPVAQAELRAVVNKAKKIIIESQDIENHFGTSEKDSGRDSKN